MIVKNFASPANMRGFPILAIGVAASHTMTETVIDGLRVTDHKLMQTRNTRHG